MIDKVFKRVYTYQAGVVCDAFTPHITNTQFNYVLPPGVIEGFVKSIDFDLQIYETIGAFRDLLPLQQNAVSYYRLQLQSVIAFANMFQNVPVGYNTGNVFNIFTPKQVFFENFRVYQGNQLNFTYFYGNSSPANLVHDVNIVLEVEEKT